jgi:hypothetical protein
MNDNAKPKGFPTLQDALEELARRREAEARRAERPAGRTFQDARENGATSRRRDVLKVHAGTKFRV